MRHHQLNFENSIWQKHLFSSLNYLNYNIHLFYYLWYGAPSHSNQWVHWNGGSHKPPEDVTSNFYSILGAYDSCDPNVLAKHMEWISQTGIGTIITSWWGKGRFEDKCVTQIMDAANKHHIKVGWHIEPYGWRTGPSVASDVDYINQKYGSHPAYFHDPDHGNRGAFYVFQSLKITDWSAIENLKQHNIILTQTTDQSKVAHFSGFYTYAVGHDPKTIDGWKGMNDYSKSYGLI